MSDKDTADADVKTCDAYADRIRQATSVDVQCHMDLYSGGTTTWARGRDRCVLGAGKRGKGGKSIDARWFARPARRPPLPGPRRRRRPSPPGRRAGMLAMDRASALSLASRWRPQRVCSRLRPPRRGAPLPAAPHALKKNRNATALLDPRFNLWPSTGAGGREAALRPVDRHRSPVRGLCFLHLVWMDTAPPRRSPPPPLQRRGPERVGGRAHPVMIPPTTSYSACAGGSLVVRTHVLDAWVAFEAVLRMHHLPCACRNLDTICPDSLSARSFMLPFGDDAALLPTPAGSCQLSCRVGDLEARGGEEGRAARRPAGGRAAGICSVCVSVGVVVCVCGCPYSGCIFLSPPRLVPFWVGWQPNCTKIVFCFECSL